MMDWGSSADCSADAEGWAGMDLPSSPEADMPAEEDSAWDVGGHGAEETPSDTAERWAETDLSSSPEADMPDEKDSAWDCADSLAADARKDAEGTDDLLTDVPRTEAEKAADYVRSFSGFEKAADYVERHYDGSEYVPGDTIPITTRNQDLEGGLSDRGVPFLRREARLDDGLILEGVFPKFNSLHHVELGDAAKDMNLYQQFSACKEDFQDHLSDNRNALEKLTIGDVDRLSESNRFTPLGYTWNHNPETGSFDLVSSDEHRSGHTGGNAFYGNS